MIGLPVAICEPPEGASYQSNAAPGTAPIAVKVDVLPGHIGLGDTETADTGTHTERVPDSISIGLIHIYFDWKSNP